ncbi:hypothetical protein FACS1894176_06420 [Bacteroidia bacterium]|nr:hypothetical protein FACS1894176_06420 [Bacteroidia bacterium]
MERRKQKKAEQFAREQEHERLTGKYRGKKAIYSREKDALIDKEGCIFEELQFKNISTGLEFTDYCPKNIPVIIVQAGWKTVYCTLDEESEFDFSVQEVRVGELAITHYLLGECITNQTEICKNLKQKDFVKLKFHLIKSKEEILIDSELMHFITRIHNVVYNKVVSVNEKNDKAD